MALDSSVPACPPAPAHTSIKPSTPASAAFSACRFHYHVVKNQVRHNYVQRQPTASYSTERCNNQWYLMFYYDFSRSASSRGFVLCTIRFTPKGAAFFPVSFSHLLRVRLLFQSPIPQSLPYFDCSEQEMCLQFHSCSIQ